LASEGRKDDEEFENGAFASAEAHDRHSPGEAEAARRGPVPDEADLAAMARERKEHVVGDVSDFPADSHRVVTVGGRQIGIFNINGEFYGLPNVCPHQTGPLCEGKMTTGTLVANKENDWKFEWAHEGEIVSCPWHGLEYHVPTGRCLAFPNINLRRYEVVVEDGKVKVRL
jgi:nitrite reductase/ring-hydroxylating ferredoxin subunit